MAARQQIPGRTPILALLLGLVLAGPAAAAPRCTTPADADAIAAGPDSLVFDRGDGLRGCLAGTTVALGRRDRAQRATVVQPFAALVGRTRDGAHSRLRIVDLRTGQVTLRRRLAPVADFRFRGGTVLAATVRRGARRDLVVVDRRGTRVFDRGVDAGVPSFSLGLVSWSRNRVFRQAVVDARGCPAGAPFPGSRWVLSFRSVRDPQAGDTAPPGSRISMLLACRPGEGVRRFVAYATARELAARDGVPRILAAGPYLLTVRTSISYGSFGPDAEVRVMDLRTGSERTANRSSSEPVRVLLAPDGRAVVFWPGQPSEVQVLAAPD